MAQDIHTSRIQTDGNGTYRGSNDSSLGDLFKQLAQDSTLLVKQEIALAKEELSANVSHAAKDVAMIAVGGGFLAVGLLVLTAFLVALLGDVLGDEYWLGALIVGVIYVAIGGFLAKKYLNDLKTTGIKPEQTLRTLREDQRWVKAEVQHVKQGMS